MHTAEPYPNSFVLRPRDWQEKLPIIPYGADVFAQIVIFGDIVVARWHRHRNRFMNLLQQNIGSGAEKQLINRSISATKHNAGVLYLTQIIQIPFFS